MISPWSAVARFPCAASLGQPCRLLERTAARLASSRRSYSLSRLGLRTEQRLQLVRPRPSISSVLAAKHSLQRRFASQNTYVDHYADLPASYEDLKGLPFRDEPLTPSEIREIFSDKIAIAPAPATRALQIWHGRRVAGTLGDPALLYPAFCKSRDTAYLEGVKQRALAWLRTHYPVDEVECAGLRAQDELKLLFPDEADKQAETIARAEKLGIYKPLTDEEKDPAMLEREKIYGRGGLDEIREMRQRQWEEEAARRKAAGEQQRLNPTTGTLQPIDGSSGGVELRRPGEHPWLKHYLERAKVLPDRPPDMSAWQRLAPSGLVVLGVLAASTAFAWLYMPAQPQNRWFPDVPPAAATVLGLIACNVAVLAAWRMPPLFRYLNMYFLVVPGYPRAMATLGSVFSHQTVTHLLSNMAVLWFMGTQLHDEVGRGSFLAIYLSAGVMGSFVSMARHVLIRRFDTSSLGASGATSGIVAAYLWLKADTEFRFLGLPPPPLNGVPGWVIFAALLGFELVSVLRGRAVITGVDYWAHLGGYATGVMAGEMIRRRRQELQRRQLERRRGIASV